MIAGLDVCFAQNAHEIMIRAAAGYLEAYHIRQLLLASVIAVEYAACRRADKGYADCSAVIGLILRAEVIGRVHFIQRPA